MKAYSLDLRRRVLSAALRGAQARTREHLEEALTAALGLVTKADLRGWFRHCGYPLARE